MIRLVAEEKLAILEADAGGAQPMPIRVLEVMNPNGSKSCRARPPKLNRTALGGATACSLPPGVIDPLHRPAGSREYELPMLAAAALNHRISDFAMRFRTT